MDQIEKMPPLKSNDVQSFEGFADLVRIAVVKLQAEGRGGELGDGALLVKKFADCHVVSYSRWLRQNKKDRSVFSLRDWLKEEVRIRVEAVEMAHGIEAETVGTAMDSVKHVDKGGRIRNLFSEGNHFGKEPVVPTSKPPCVYCGGNHGVWSCRRFQNMGVNERWNVVRDKRLWQVITKKELVPRLDLVTVMVVKEIIITYCMVSHKVTLRKGEWCLHGRGHQLTHTHRPPSRRQQLRSFLFVACQCG